MQENFDINMNQTKKYDSVEKNMYLSLLKQSYIHTYTNAVSHDATKKMKN